MSQTFLSRTKLPSYNILCKTSGSCRNQCVKQTELVRLVWYLRGLIEAWQPANLRWSFFGATAAAERQQSSFADQQHVPDVQVDVLLALLLVVIERLVLEALRAHGGLWLHNN